MGDFFLFRLNPLSVREWWLHLYAKTMLFHSVALSHFISLVLELWCAATTFCRVASGHSVVTATSIPFAWVLPLPCEVVTALFSGSFQ
jgi:hypothetical protein